MKRDKTKENYDLIRELQRRVYDLELQGPEYDSQQKEREDNTWIDLDINELPERFFTREDIEIEWKGYGTEKWAKFPLGKDLRYRVIDDVVNCSDSFKYRLQEKKEPMRITQKLHDALLFEAAQNCAHLVFQPNLESLYGRKIIIID